MVASANTMAADMSAVKIASSLRPHAGSITFALPE